MDVQALPAVNATLNGIAAVLLAIGYTLIRKKRIQAHKRVMLTAFSVSVVFLACYLIIISRRHRVRPEDRITSLRFT